jgi:hypothetical protein
MKKHAVIIITSFIICFIHFSFGYVILGFFSPNPLVIIPLGLLHNNKKNTAFFSAFTLGLFADLFTGGFIGFMPLVILMLVGVYLATRYRLGQFSFITAIVVWLSSIVLDQVVHRIVYAQQFILWHSLVQATINVVFVFVFIKFLHKLPKGDWLGKKNDN